MQQAFLSIALGGLGRDALKVGAGVALAVVLALAFAVASIAALFAAPAVAPTAVPDLGPGRVISGPPSSLVVEIARTQLGKPYLWGGARPETGFDCSGLVQWAYRQVGIALPRTAQQQFDATARINTEQLEPGDLVFFQICCQPPDTVTHVGIYVGSGQMIHAPAPGESVRVESINTPYWRSHFAGAGRPARGPTGAVQ